MRRSAGTTVSASFGRLTEIRSPGTSISTRQYWDQIPWYKYTHPSVLGSDPLVQVCPWVSTEIRDPARPWRQQVVSPLL
eukprot:2187407-Rhodomonas_salina.2